MKRMIKTAGFAAALAFGMATGMNGAAAQAPVQLLTAVQAPTVTPDFLLGRWTDNGNCAEAVDFFADGRFRTTAGAEGRWTLQGSQLSFIGSSTITARVEASSRDAITLTHSDGSVGSSTRCAAQGPRRIAMPPLPATAAEVLRIGGPVNRELLLGSWTDDGNCGVAIQFLADGRFTIPNGNGRWTLVGDRLSFIGNSTVVAQVRAVGRNRILLIHPDGRIGQSMRC